MGVIPNKNLGVLGTLGVLAGTSSASVRRDSDFLLSRFQGSMVLNDMARLVPDLSGAFFAGFLWIAVGCVTPLACSNKVEVLTSGTGGTAAGSGGATSQGSGGTGAKAGSSATTATGGALVLPRACPGFDVMTRSVDAGDAVDFDAGGECNGIGKEIEPVPLDMFIMMDRSDSMKNPVQGTALTRWDVLQQGVQQFLSDPDVIAKKPRVGLSFFSKTGNPSDPIECLAETYATPQIEMEFIETGGPKILQAIADEAKYLGGQTAWQPALQGALMHAQAWKANDTLGRMAVVVLVTDGYATECETSISAIQETVGEYYSGIVGTYNTVGKPGIRTYVVGIAVDKFNLDAVAQAGGTGAATIVDNAGAVAQFVTSMINITGSQIECTYDMPLQAYGMKVDPDKVQVIYEPFVGESQEIPRASSAVDCGSAHGGWYFDDASSPTKVSLCPCSCANLGAGHVTFRFGCRPIPVAN